MRQCFCCCFWMCFPPQSMLFPLKRPVASFTLMFHYCLVVAKSSVNTITNIRWLLPVICLSCNCNSFLNFTSDLANVIMLPYVYAKPLLMRYFNNCRVVKNHFWMYRTQAVLKKHTEQQLEASAFFSCLLWSVCYIRYNPGEKPSKPCNSWRFLLKSLCNK